MIEDFRKFFNACNWKTREFKLKVYLYLSCLPQRKYLQGVLDILLDNSSENILSDFEVVLAVAIGYHFMNQKSKALSCLSALNNLEPPLEYLDDEKFLWKSQISSNIDDLNHILSCTTDDHVKSMVLYCKAYIEFKVNNIDCCVQYLLDAIAKNSTNVKAINFLLCEIYIEPTNHFSIENATNLLETYCTVVNAGHSNATDVSREWLIGNYCKKFLVVEYLYLSKCISRMYAEKTDVRRLQFIERKQSALLEMNRLGCGVNDPFFNTALSKVIYLVKGIDKEKNAWYYMAVDPILLLQFTNQLKDPIIHLTELGIILRSDYGDEPPLAVTLEMKHSFVDESKETSHTAKLIVLLDTLCDWKG